MTSLKSIKRSLSNEKLDKKFTITCKDDWWSDLLDDDLKQHFSRLKLNNIKDSILTRPINSTHRIDAQRYLYETFNEKLKQNTLYTNFYHELNRFISEYEKDLFNKSNNDFAKYKSELDNQVEHLKLNETLFQRLISLEIKPCQLAQMSDEQKKQLKENNEGKGKTLILNFFAEIPYKTLKL
jgi:hypothetical protein